MTLNFSEFAALFKNMFPSIITVQYRKKLLLFFLTDNFITTHNSLHKN